MPSMTLLRKLTEGLGAWLHYEYCCNRSALFSEKYLAPPVGVVLSSAQLGQVFAEFEHPILTTHMIGRGRRPALDFVICKEYPIPHVAIETKWIGASSIGVDDLVWDLVRLALLNVHHGTTCYFIIGGRRRDIERFFASKHFTGPKATPEVVPVMNTRSNHQSCIPLIPIHRYRIPLLRKVFDGWPENLQSPQKVITRRTNPFPHRPAGGQYQVYAWEVFCPPKKELFWPRNSTHYVDVVKRTESLGHTEGDIRDLDR